jgi:hypothetical protein
MPVSYYREKKVVHRHLAVKPTNSADGMPVMIAPAFDAR